MSAPSTATILIVEDEASQAATFEGYLCREGYTVSTEGMGRTALDRLRQSPPDALILDLHLPDIDGLDILRECRATHPHMPVIVVTGDTSPQMALAAMHNGAADFILKPVSSARLTVTLRNAMERATLEREVSEWRKTLGQSAHPSFIGQSPAMLAVYRIIDSVAASKASVFITGESGTGKELAAEALHKASPRRAKPFVAINCGAIPRELLESTLFGHVKGAFTGAVSDHIGAAKKADGGTLFLDEVCELPLALQVKLLRFLQTGEIAPVGGNKNEIVDVRIVAATNRTPQGEVKNGNFREDLYYRLHVVPLEMPPLRDRDDDILLLAEHFLNKFGADEGKKFTALSPDAASMLRRYDWPGNVRQLENTLHAIVAMHEGSIVTAAMLPDELCGVTTNVPAAPSVTPSVAYANDIKPLWETEKNAILMALTATQQDVNKAATLLEVSPSTLYRKLHSWKANAAA